MTLLNYHHSPVRNLDTTQLTQCRLLTPTSTRRPCSCRMNPALRRPGGRGQQWATERCTHAQSEVLCWPRTHSLQRAAVVTQQAGKRTCYQTPTTSNNSHSTPPSQRLTVAAYSRRGCKRQAGPQTALPAVQAVQSQPAGGSEQRLCVEHAVVDAGWAGDKEQHCCGYNTGFAHEPLAQPDMCVCVGLV